MIQNQKLYKEFALKDKVARLRNLTISEAARELEELADFGWPFIQKKVCPLPVSLRQLIKKA